MATSGAPREPEVTELRPVHHGVRGSSSRRGARPSSFVWVTHPPRRAAASSILSSLQQGPGAAIFPRTQLVPGGTDSPSSKARVSAPPGQAEPGTEATWLRHPTPTPGHLPQVTGLAPFQVASDMCSETGGPRSPNSCLTRLWTPYEQVSHSFVPRAAGKSSRAAGQKPKRGQSGTRRRGRTPR